MTLLTRRSMLVSGAAGALAAGMAFPSRVLGAGDEAGDGLAALAAGRGLKFGTALARFELEKTPELAGLVRREAAIITPSLELKWARLRPAETEFNFDDADFMMAFARSNRLEVRGHTLVWHEAMPLWFKDALESRTPSDIRALLEEHIDRVCTRYAGRIHSWDVVNEVLEPMDRQSGGLRASPLYRRLGRDYIELAFRAAAAADPDARLVINDFSLETAASGDEVRRRAMLDLLNSLVRRQVPVHALGVQAHLAAAGDRFEPEVFRRFVREVADLGLEVFITELDVGDRVLPPETAIRDRAVADTYRQFLDGALAEPAVRLLAVWGLSDRDSWMNDSPYASRRDGLPVRANPYDADLHPKPARAAIAEALRTAPIRAG